VCLPEQLQALGFLFLLGLSFIVRFVFFCLGLGFRFGFRLSFSFRFGFRFSGYFRFFCFFFAIGSFSLGLLCCLRGFLFLRWSFFRFSFNLGFVNNLGNFPFLSRSFFRFRVSLGFRFGFRGFFYSFFRIFLLARLCFLLTLPDEVITTCPRIDLRARLFSFL